MAFINFNSVEQLFKTLANEAQKQQRQQQASQPKPAAPVAASTGQESFAAKTEAMPSGFSWGEEMPDEPNQYNFDGTFEEYFESIFRERFPMYGYSKEALGRSRVVYTFRSGGMRSLVIELMPETCSAKKIRRTCEEQRIPYLRFYINHDGWWNTRRYVVTRVRSALGM